MSNLSLIKQIYGKKYYIYRCNLEFSELKKELRKIKLKHPTHDYTHVVLNKRIPKSLVFKEIPAVVFSSKYDYDNVFELCKIDFYSYLENKNKFDPYCIWNKIYNSDLKKELKPFSVVNDVDKILDVLLDLTDWKAIEQLSKAF